MQKRVLVIDDDTSLQDLMQAILELKDFEVILAENGQDALEKLAKKQPDLILLDLMMPGMDGYSFAEELQRRGLCAAVPILVLTADVSAKPQVEQLGINSFVTKPFELRGFLQEVSKLMYPLPA